MGIGMKYFEILLYELMVTSTILSRLSVTNAG